MKTVLRRCAIAFIVLGVVGLIAGLSARVLMKRNRDARSSYYASVVVPTEERVRQDYLRASATLEAAKVPGTIAQVPTMDFGALSASRSGLDNYERPYEQLTFFKLISDSVIFGSFLLMLYCFAAIRAIDLKNSRSNQSTDPTLASGTPGAGHQSRHP
jgi:hypothetical protein